MRGSLTCAPPLFPRGDLPVRGPGFRWGRVSGSAARDGLSLRAAPAGKAADLGAPVLATRERARHPLLPSIVVSGALAASPPTVDSFHLPVVFRGPSLRGRAYC